MERKWDAPGNFMENFEKSFTGIVGHYFCTAVRGGAKTVDQVLVSVAAEAKQRIEVYDGTRDTQYLEILLEAIDLPSAREFAEHILWRENLPRDEKEALKAKGKADSAREHMADYPATEAQINYLKKLGVLDAPKNKAHASELIGARLQNSHP